MLCLRGRIALRPFHVDRLRQGAERLSIAIDERDVDGALEPASTLPDVHILRLHLSAGSGPRGYAAQGSGPARLSLQVFPSERDPFVIAPRARVCLAETSIALQPALAGIKHCNRLEQVLAATEARERGVDEALMFSRSGDLYCASSANVFILSGEQLRTPACDQAGVEGTRRRLILEQLALKVGLRVEEGAITAAECQDADALVLTNARFGIREVSELEGHVYEPQEAVNRLQAAYLEVLRACLDA